ncbi:MAG: hypothetical protein ACI4SS_04110 [Clostridia bacterium]
MIELFITGLIAFLLLFCFYTLFFGSDKCGSCCGLFTKEELIEALKNVPDGSIIYISIEKKR